ncbi:MAG: head-tail connector protein [Roseovarius sp.]
MVEAVLQLAAWWYEQRETALTGTIVAEVPFGVQEIITAYREFTF